MAASNSINEVTTGICGFTGTAFTSTPVTQYDVLVGGSTSSTISNIAPSATSGVPLISQGSSSNPAFGTAVVSGGGTGNTTFTAYSVICAGTTATGTFQNVSGVGTAGQVLTSNGASTLPTWQAGGGGGGSTFTTTNVVLTSAQVKALAGTPITIVAAQGSGIAIIPFSCSIKKFYAGTNAFTAGSNLVICYLDRSTFKIMQLDDAVVTGTTSKYITAGLLSYVQGTSTDITNVENQPLVVSVDGADFTGNAANDNTVTVSVSYYTLNI